MKGDVATGALVASLAAGPLFVSPLVIASLVATPRIDPAALVLLPFVALFAVLFGFVLSLIPNLVGAAAMSAAGRRHRAMRHPLAWAAVGFVAGWLIAAAVTLDLSADTAPVGIEGLACALICRRFASWPD